MKEKTYRKSRVIIWSVVFGLLFVLGVTLITICAWYAQTYNLEFKELLYTLASPLKGTGQSTISLIVSTCLPWALAGAILYAVIAVVLAQKKKHFQLLRRIGAGFCAAVLLFSVVFAFFALRLPNYIETLTQKTTLYEEYYVDPEKVAITADGETKNLIYIYLESMETTYASSAIGGSQPIANYIPNLTELTGEGLTFTDKEEGQLGGFHSVNGTTWTIAALLSMTSGIPFSFPVGDQGHNTMSNRQYFASGLTTLGDILAEKGYRQEFLCGSDATFGGRRTYFEQHGNYEIFDLYTAREEGYIAKDYYKWWGYEDSILFEIAKDELLELAAGDQPFNFTMLTVDAHHVNGFVCDECDYTAPDSDASDTEKNENKLSTVLRCTDRQVAAFVEWCQAQDFYEDTVIIITGDHPRMDTTLVSGVSYYDRTIYNCIFNAAVTPQGETTLRTFTSLDMFPTTLAAMGFSIEGDRLGLGTNMFSSRQTLAEELGYQYLNTELNKYSEYYVREFS